MKERKISIDGAFKGFKETLLDEMQNLIDTMHQKEAQKGTITIRLDIEFPEKISNKKLEVPCPIFRHRITSKMRFNAASKGEFGGAGCTLFWDKRYQNWKVRITSGK